MKRTSKKKSRRHYSGESTGRVQADATCREETAFLDRYLSSALDERQRARFESHLAVCGDCVAFLQTYKATIELTRSFLAGEISPARPSELLRKRRLRRTFSQ